jgi:hypothetical protein
VTRTLTAHERGSALITAIAVALFVGLIIAASFTLLDRSGERVSSRSSRAASVAVVDRALTSYEFALQSLLTDETKDFRLDRNAMLQLAASPEAGTRDSTPVLNSKLPSRLKQLGLDQTYPGNDYTMRMTLANGTIGWWQPIAVLPPSTTNPNLILYVRTWTSTIAANPRLVGDARIVRADLRPGRFSDYQILVDGPIIMGYGVTLSGRVHTNGYPDSYMADQWTTPGSPMQLIASDPPACKSGAAFSTATGSIVGKGSCTGFNAQYTENDHRRIDLLRGSEHLNKLRTMCGGGSVACPPGNGPWTIKLSGSTAHFTGPGFNKTYDASAGAVVLVRGSASLSGELTRKSALTIGIQDTGNFSAFGSSSLSLVGNAKIGATDNSILGLIVDGDVIPRIDKGQCPRGLRAAMVSSSGSLSIPPQYRVPNAPGVGSLPYCGNTFSFVGSLGAHYMPFMIGGFGNVPVGFAGRAYDYDSRLLMTPPPLFPTTGPWQVSTWKDADPACLDANDINDAECG